MRMTKFMFTFCAILLFSMFANGAYFLLHSAEIRQGGVHNPISYLKGENPYDPGFRRMESSTSEELPVNMLVLGLDGEKTRSDVILLFHFEPETSKLSVLSIARDTLVQVGDRYYKFNALYAKGGELLLAQKVTEITGLPVHYYVTMDFKGFRRVIDTLGGVQFYVPFRMDYDDPTQDLHIHLKKGLQVLDGDKAEQLVRYRKGNRKGQGYTEGDIGRIGMQQDFIRALISQKLNFRYLSRIDDLFGILRLYVKTNMNLSDITRYIGSAGKIEAEKITTVTLPGYSKMIDGAWYFILDEEETRKIIDMNCVR